MISFAIEYGVCGSLTEILTEGTPESVMMPVLLEGWRCVGVWLKCSGRGILKYCEPSCLRILLEVEWALCNFL
jgi:hypothetical protein